MEGIRSRLEAMSLLILHKGGLIVARPIQEMPELGDLALLACDMVQIPLRSGQRWFPCPRMAKIIDTMTEYHFFSPLAFLSVSCTHSAYRESA